MCGKGHAERSEVSSDRQDGIYFDGFSQVQGMKLAFHLGSLIYAADEEGMHLQEVAVEVHSSKTPWIYSYTRMKIYNEKYTVKGTGTLPLV